MGKQSGTSSSSSYPSDLSSVIIAPIVLCGVRMCLFVSCICQLFETCTVSDSPYIVKGKVSKYAAA